MAFEIERKYLVEEVPHNKDWPLAYIGPIVDDHITQTYLVPTEKGTTERVRSRNHKGKTTYTHTIKKRVTAVTAEENERKITTKEYKEFLLRADPDCVPINKIRRVFKWAKHTFELDMFLGAHLKELVILEVELQSEREPIILPPWLPVLREVTGEKEYTNAFLSRKNP